jgi:hypothetical protein
MALRQLVTRVLRVVPAKEGWRADLLAPASCARLQGEPRVSKTVPPGCRCIEAAH